MFSMCVHDRAQTKTNFFVSGCVRTCVCACVCLRVCKAPRCLSAAGETHSVQGHLQRVDAKGSLLPGPTPVSWEGGKTLECGGSVLGIHPEPTLKTEDARPHQPWRSNRAKMQAVNQEAFAIPVFNYWHFQRCASVLSTQQEKIHLDFALTQLVSSDQGLSEVRDDELAVNKVQLRCCWMKDTNIVFKYTLKVRINKMEKKTKFHQCIDFCTLWQGQADADRQNIHSARVIQKNMTIEPLTYTFKYVPSFYFLINSILSAWAL